MIALPERIQSPRLLLRSWQPDDAPAQLAVLAANLAFLRRWMVWALDEPMERSVKREQLALFRQRFVDGIEWIYAIEATPEVAESLGGIVAPTLLGSIGAHARTADEGRVEWDPSRGVPPCMEIGYWLREEATGRGLCTEAVAALGETLFTAGVPRIEIRTHPENHPSRAIPQRLGFVREKVLPGIIRMPDGGVAAGEVWVGGTRIACAQRQP